MMTLCAAHYCRGVSDVVHAYYQDQPEPQRTTLLAVRSSIRRILPGALESISYGMPTFKIDGTAVAGIAGFKQHCSYFPYAGEVLEVHADALRSYDQNKGTLRFPTDAPLPLALLRKMLATRLELEHEPIETGKVRRFYANGFVQSKGVMRNGEMHGSWQWFRKDGSLMRAGHFRHGAQVGTWQTWDRNGNLVKTTSFNP
jgi:uncharacterized protein YdhG (YjbR/CyaY superfamily)